MNDRWKKIRTSDGDIAHVAKFDVGGLPMLIVAMREANVPVGVEFMRREGRWLLLNFAHPDARP